MSNSCAVCQGPAHIRCLCNKAVYCSETCRVAGWRAGHRDVCIRRIGGPLSEAHEKSVTIAPVWLESDAQLPDYFVKASSKWRDVLAALPSFLPSPADYGIWTLPDGRRLNKEIPLDSRIDESYAGPDNVPDEIQINIE